MKKLMLCLLLAAFTTFGHSQIVLEETKVSYEPARSMKVDPVTQVLTLEIPESFVGEFQQDPLAFIGKNFNIDRFIQDNREFDYDIYHVKFKASNGNVLAKYDEDGALVSTHQRFNNVALPNDVRLQLLRDHSTAKILKNSHVVTSRSWEIDKDFYKIKIQDGNKVKRIKINSTQEAVGQVQN